MTMNDVLGIGCSILSALFVLYFFWSRHKVWILRQDLFIIRNELWDQMREKGALDDPGHRKARRVLNRAIRHAPIFSPYVLVKALFGRNQDIDMAWINEAPAEVQEALDKASARLTHYFVAESVYMVVIMMVLRLIHLRETITKQLKLWSERFMNIDESDLNASIAS